jgi:hypothetical protein
MMAAMEHAEQLVDDHDIELWKLERKTTKLKSPPSPCISTWGRSRPVRSPSPPIRYPMPRSGPQQMTVRLCALALPCPSSGSSIAQSSSLYSRRSSSAAVTPVAFASMSNLSTRKRRHEWAIHWTRPQCGMQRLSYAASARQPRRAWRASATSDLFPSPGGELHAGLGTLLRTEQNELVA